MSLKITPQLQELADRLDAIANPDLPESALQPALPLSEILQELWQFCRGQTQPTTALTELGNWLELELSGYGSNPARQLPAYRQVRLDYFDQGGQSIKSIDDRYRAWNLTQSITKLEAHQKNGLTLTLAPQITAFLSQTAGKEIFGGYVSAKQIKAIVTLTRDHAASLLAEVLPQS
jgi:hypothetical protein